MDYQLAKDLFGMAAVVTGWLVLVGVAVSGLRGQARVRLLEDEYPVEALALDELASSSVEQVCSRLHHAPASAPSRSQTRTHTSARV